MLADDLKAMLMRHEGKRDRMYLDSVGVPTIGIGHNLNVPISHAAVMQIFEDDLREAQSQCLHAFPWFAELTEERQWVLINMCFNMGLPRLLGFKKMLAALALDDYDTAAKEMMDSHWAQQVGHRAVELATLMRGTDGSS